MGTVIDFKAITSSDAFKAAIHQIIADDDPSYKWLSECATSIDESVKRWLVQHPIEPDAYEIFAVEAHFSEAGILLDRCLSRKAEILALESQAIGVALDAKLTESMQPIELRLLQAQASAYSKEAGFSAADADALQEQVQKKYDTLTAARQSRLFWYGMPGGALNYGERILYLRELYADNVKTIIERLIPCRLGLSRCFGVEVDESDLHGTPFPSDFTSGKDLVTILLKWTRAAVDKFQKVQQKEKVFSTVLRLKADGLVPNLLQSIKLPGTMNLSFEVKPEHVGLGHAETCRVLGVAVVPSFRNNDDAIGIFDDTVNNVVLQEFCFLDEYMRRIVRSYIFPITLSVPNQEGAALGVNLYSGSKSVRFGTVCPWADGPLEAVAPLLTDEQLHNRSPFGYWSISMEDKVISPSGNVRRSELVYPATYEKNKVWASKAWLAAFEEISLVLRLGSRAG